MAIRNVYEDAERSVLGSLLLAPEICATEVFNTVKQDDFTDSEYKTIFKIIYQLYQKNKPIDSISVLAKAGDEYRDMILQILEITPTAMNFRGYVELLLQCSKQYKAQQLADEISEKAAHGAAVEELQNLTETLLTDLSSSRISKAVQMKDMLFNFYNRVGQKRTYLDWGYDKLNSHLYSSYGDYIVVGARPSVGKTAFALNLAIQLAEKHAVSFFSLETDENKITDRIMSFVSGVSFSKIKKGETEETDISALTNCKKKLLSLDFNFVPAAGFTVDDIRAETLRSKSKIIFIDYIGLIAHVDKRLGSYERATSISMALHTMAQQYGITIVALCQLNRAGTGEPSMEHLRDSGQIEQDADVIMFLSRPEIFGDQDNEERKQKEFQRVLSISKNKEGKCGKIQFYFDGSTQKFKQGWNHFYPTDIYIPKPVIKQFEKEKTEQLKL